MHREAMKSRAEVRRQGSPWTATRATLGWISGASSGHGLAPELIADQGFELRWVQGLEMARQDVALFHSAAICERQFLQLRLVLEEEELQLLHLLVLRPGHRFLRELITGVVVDGECHIEGKQVYQLPK